MGTTKNNHLVSFFCFYFNHNLSIKWKHIGFKINLLDSLSSTLNTFQLLSSGFFTSDWQVRSFRICFTLEICWSHVCLWPPLLLILQVLGVLSGLLSPLSCLPTWPTSGMSWDMFSWCEWLWNYLRRSHWKCWKDDTQGYQSDMDGLFLLLHVTSHLSGSKCLNYIIYVSVPFPWNMSGQLSPDLMSWFLCFVFFLFINLFFTSGFTVVYFPWN